MTNTITLALLASTLRLAWGIIRIGSIAHEWTMTAERRPDAIERLCQRAVGAGETLVAMVDRAAARRGIFADVLDRVAYAG
jgi:hypothetical protein